MSEIDLPLNQGQDLVLVVPGIDRPCARLPVPSVSPEDLLGHGLEKEYLRDGGRWLVTTSPRCQQGPGLEARTLEGDVTGIANRMPDAITVDLAVEEVAFTARGQDPDTEAHQISISGTS